MTFQPAGGPDSATPRRRTHNTERRETAAQDAEEPEFEEEDREVLRALDGWGQNDTTLESPAPSLPEALCYRRRRRSSFGRDD